MAQKEEKDEQKMLSDLGRIINDVLKGIGSYFLIELVELRKPKTTSATRNPSIWT